jgi:hypothetical protein
MKCLVTLGLMLSPGMFASAFACSASPTEPTPCSSTPTEPSRATTSTYDSVVATSDYTSSEVGLVALDGPSDFASSVDLGADPTLTSSAGRYFWVARDVGKIIEFDTAPLHAVATYDANDPDAKGSSNPYDVAVAPDGSLWIARFDVPTVLVLNPDGCRRMTIDLSSEDPVDGNPNMGSIRILDPTGQPDAAGSMATSKAYVSLDILDDHSDLKSTRKSKLARIDLETGTVEDVLTLAGRNPLTLMVQLGNQLYLADAGTWCTAGACPAGQPDAGIERVDTASFTSKLLLTGTALGGHASEVAVTASCGVAVVAGALPDTPTSLVGFDPTQGDGTVARRTVIPTTTSFTLQGLAWVGGNVLFVGDRGQGDGGAGVHVFDLDVAAGCTLTERCTLLPLLLPPVGFVALR